MTSADDELDRRMRDVHERAQENYDDDPVAAVLNHLWDTYNAMNDDVPPAFSKGMEQAIHEVNVLYITYSGEYTCECPDGYVFPELTTDAWYCGNCGAYLVEEWELPGARRYMSAEQD